MERKKPDKKLKDLARVMDDRIFLESVRTFYEVF
jgi:hypothetical protein